MNYALMNALTLTIEPRENILDGITLYESIDTAILDKLINSTLLKEEFNNPICQTLYKNEKLQLQKYRELVENGKAKVLYKRNENNPYGRSNPVGGLGLFPIRREIRHTLAKENKVDIDIDNAHPEMEKQILTANGKDCPLLTDYVANREEWLELVRKAFKIKDMECVKENPSLLKEIPKNLFIRILYGGGVWAWKKKWNIDGLNIPKKVLDFIQEVEGLNRIIARANPHLLGIVSDTKIRQGKMDADGFCVQTKEEKDRNKPKRKYNLNASVCSYFLQEKEIIILEQIFTYCVSKEYIKDDDCVLCADGLMIERQLYKPTLLSELHIVVKMTTGFSLNFSQKEMNQDYLSILDKSLCFDLYHPIYSTGMIADYFRIMYSNKFLNVNGEVYIYTGTYWRKEIDKKHSTIHNFVDTTFYKHLVDYISKLISEKNVEIGKLDDGEENKAMFDSLSNELGIMTDFLKNINIQIRGVKQRRLLVDDIINKICCHHVKFDNNPYLFAFTNKVFDLQQDSFIPAKYNQYITMTTGWDWCSYYPVEYKNELESIIENMLPSKAINEYYLMALSTGLFGQQIQKLFCATGIGGNGKSVLHGLALIALGHYCYTLPSKILLGEIKDGANPEVANLHKKRLVIVAEPDGKRRMKGSTVKELTGNAEINCRDLYSSNTKTILHLTLLVEANNLPKFEGDEVGRSIQRRVEVTPFNSKFYSKAEYDAKTPQERKEEQIMLGNPYYIEEAFKQKYKQALILILMEHFKKFRENDYQMPETPKECKEKTKDYLASSDDIYSWFCQYYEKVESTDGAYIDDEALELKAVHQKFTNTEYYDTMSKKEKQENNLKKFTDKIRENLFLKKFLKPKDTIYKGKKHRTEYIIGFKLITEPDNDVEPPVDEMTQEP